MATMESMIKYINKKLSDFREYYGEKSYHYQHLASVLFNIENIPNYAPQEQSSGIWGKHSVAIKMEPNKPIRIARKKDVLENISINPVAMDELTDIYDYYKAYGTVRQTAFESISELIKGSKIIVDHNEIKGQELQTFQPILRDIQHEKYLSEFQDKDLYLIYEEADDLGMEEAFKDDEERDDEYLKDLEDVKKAFEEKGEGIRERKANDIMKAFEAAKQAHKERLKERLNVSEDNSDNAPAPANPYNMSL